MPGQSFGDLPLMLSRNAWDAIYTTGGTSHQTEAHQNGDKCMHLSSESFSYLPTQMNAHPACLLLSPQGHHHRMVWRRFGRHFGPSSVGLCVPAFFVSNAPNAVPQTTAIAC
eukprot:1852572-Pleurochrysis_carterae.AAC.3